jgi:hypothetical protein
MRQSRDDTARESDKAARADTTPQALVVLIVLLVLILPVGGYASLHSRELFSFSSKCFFIKSFLKSVFCIFAILDFITGL